MSIARACLLLYNIIHKVGAETYFGVTTEEKISLSEVTGSGIKIKNITTFGKERELGREPLLRAETRRPDAAS